VQIELLGAALDQFKLDVGRYPSSQEGLTALQQSPGNAPGWEGPYLKKDIPLDPWGSPYQYRSPGEHGEYDIVSLGSDRAAGGDGEAADVTSWGAEGKTR
jgi:general secretion pathway protein G